ncbi:hypothetical protein PVK06_041093 [Gossypium arboreum]|uniref:Uncharacterized protein n=1 Tax=Gossypium arboreum TaxID=29729 RepID=A0ABR0N7K3_GOSAR|nr:hypothetical protein PVK06_041093 [Gossypium arboreum]
MSNHNNQLTFYGLATLMPRMGLRQAKQNEAGHVANLNVEQLKDEIYKLQRTMRIWRNEFLVIFDVSNWEVPPPAFEMVPDRSLYKHPKGRPQSPRIRNDMDIKETGEPKLCTVCRTSRHNRSTCPHRVYVSDQSSRNVVVED